MAVIGLGERLVIMQGFARQKAVARDPKKKARVIHYRRYVVPSETKYSLQARIALAEAAISARGKSFEEVIATVVERCSGKTYKPADVREAEKRARYLAADANLKRMKEKLNLMIARGEVKGWIGALAEAATKA